MEPMKLLRIDLVSTFDLDLARPIDQKILAGLERAAAIHNRHAQIYADSFGWLFYGEMLRGFGRFVFNPPKGLRSCGGRVGRHAGLQQDESGIVANVAR